MSAISDCRFLVEVSIRPREELVDVKSQYIRIISKIWVQRKILGNRS